MQTLQISSKVLINPLVMDAVLKKGIGHETFLHDFLEILKRMLDNSNKICPVYYMFHAVFHVILCITCSMQYALQIPYVYE